VLADDGRPIAPELTLPWPLTGRWGTAGSLRAAIPGGDLPVGLDGDTATDGDAPIDGDAPEPDRGRTRPLVLAAAAGAVALFVALNLPVSAVVPLLALALAGVVALAARSRRAGGLLALAGALVLSGAAAYIVLLQNRRHFPAGFEWSTNFPHAHLFGLIAVLLLGGEAVRDLLTRRAGRTPAEG
jgi:hypothetical protein